MKGLAVKILTQVFGSISKCFASVCCKSPKNVSVCDNVVATVAGDVVATLIYARHDAAGCRDATKTGYVLVIIRREVTGSEVVFREGQTCQCKDTAW